MTLDVLHVSSAHSVRDTRIFVKQAASLAERYRVGVLGPGRQTQDWEQDGVAMQSLLRPTDRLARFTSFKKALIRRIFEIRPRIVHLHDPDLLLALPRLQRGGIKVIYDAHEDFSQAPLSREWLGPPLLRYGVASGFDQIERRLAQRANGVVVADRQLLARFPGASVVRNYLVLEEWPDPAPRPSKTAIRCIYVGDVTRARGVFRMCDAMEAARSHGVAVELDLIGPVDQTLMPEIERHPAFASITVHGLLSRAEVAAQLARADVALCLPKPFPAYQSALPVKLLEYHAMKLPVVVTDTPRMRQETGLAPGLIRVPWTAPPALVAASIRTASALSTQRRRQLREHVLTHYAWGGEKEALFALYDRVFAQLEPKLAHVA